MIAQESTKISPPEEDTLLFRQGLQRFFLRKILSRRYNRETFLAQSFGRDFFQQWSTTAHQADANPGELQSLLRDLPISPSVSKEIDESGKTKSNTLRGASALIEHERTKQLIDSVPEVYRALLEKVLNGPRAADLLLLLSDPDIDELMRIPFPVDKGMATSIGTMRLESAVILEAIARAAGLQAEDIHREMFPQIFILDLSGLEISDINDLRNLPNLKHLALRDTSVRKLDPLQRLSDLTVLDLGNTGVVDIQPLCGLSALKSLDLGGTPLKDFEYLSELHSLEEISLSRTAVSDLRPLSQLGQLRKLFLRETQVEDIRPLKHLSALEDLSLSSTPIQDLRPLEQMTRLRRLYLSGSDVADLQPVETLAALEELYLSDTSVSDVQPLKSLKKLRELDLSGTAVADIRPLTELEYLDKLYLGGSGVSARSVPKVLKDRLSEIDFTKL